MENLDNRNVLFNSPETAYLYGLGQSIANITKIGDSETLKYDSYFEYRTKQIKQVHQLAMEVLNKNNKIDLKK